MARITPNTSRTNTIDSQTSAPSPSQLYSDQFRSGSSAYLSSLNSSQASLHRPSTQETAVDEPPVPSASRTPGSANPQSAGISPTIRQTAGVATQSSSTAGLSGLVCNVHRTTGREPPPLVGATTTVLGDRLYVFGGRRISRTRPQLTADLYELDLIRRHWTKLEARGDLPPPRYFHSVCALGDTKLVCYGGMSPFLLPNGQPTVPEQQPNPQESQPEVVVMSDIHIYDVPTGTWMKIPTTNSPEGRYAHCATILPSSASFSSAKAITSAIQHNPASSDPNQGSIGVAIDGTGGTEMLVVGGQDGANHYIEQISVFNLRSLRWTKTTTLGRSCGAYRSVVATLDTMDFKQIGAGAGKSRDQESEEEQEAKDPSESGSAMLIYSNYNFLDVKLELQIRHPDGTLTEKPVGGSVAPPGMRFPNGGVIANHFVVSGTFLTSSKQEYALWALDLRTLTWSRIDAGGGPIFSQGSWNRGVLWNRRNTFVILGNRKRSLVDDYNHRRINFSNVCMVELEAFGLYDNPRHTAPTSGYTSVSAPLQLSKLDPNAGGRSLSSAAADLGAMAIGFRELADMDILAIGGERIPVNSHLVARRWGPYFNQLLREGIASHEGTDTATLRGPTSAGHPSRNSSVTITPSVKTGYSAATTLVGGSSAYPSSDSASLAPSNLSSGTAGPGSANDTLFDPPHPAKPLPTSRPRTLYLPHTALTLSALVQFLYTSSLPPPSSNLCTPQILCSLLQLARPYRIDGLLEAVVERLHGKLDGRNTAAIFNAAAMAAGGGSAVSFFSESGVLSPEDQRPTALTASALASSGFADDREGITAEGLMSLSIDTTVNNSRQDDEISSASTSSTASGVSERSGEEELWNGVFSAVVGLQKRGLRGLMEGRRIREMGRSGEPRGGEGTTAGFGTSGGQGLGIA